MNEEIKLPPLPDNGTMLAYGADTLRNYARLAVEQDRARREKLGPQKPEPYRAAIKLYDDGEWCDDLWLRGQIWPQHCITLRWTPERVWIESERNRALAQELRKNACCPLDYDSADALDGGER